MTDSLPAKKERVYTVLCDTREPWPHPWARWLPANIRLERGTMETGDFALLALPAGSVIERKTPSDLAGCIGGSRERFERELARSRYVGRMAVLVEGTLGDLVVVARGIHQNAVLGSLAAWTARYGVAFVFCETAALAADFAWRFLLCQVRDAEKVVAACGVDIPCPEKRAHGASGVIAV